MKKAFLKAVVLATALCVNFQFASGQNDSIRSADALRFAYGVMHNFSSPFRWSKKDWTTTSIVVFSTIAISSLDKPMNRFWLGKQDPFLNVINDAGYWYGTPYSGLILTGGFYLTGWALKNEWARETGLILGTAFTTSTLLVSIIKPLAGRARPGYGSGLYDFHPFSKAPEYHALPSGHAAIALTISLVMANRINNKPLKILFYSLAASTAFCRLYANAHWLSDVGLSCAIAWFSASAAVDQLSDNRWRKARKTQISLVPSFSGMTLRIRFNESFTK